MLSYFAAVAVVFGGGLLVSAVWLWFETSTVGDGDFPGFMGRLTLIVLMLIPAVIVCGIAAVVAGFGAVIVVGAVRSGIAITRWVRKRRDGKAVAVRE